MYITKITIGWVILIHFFWCLPIKAQNGPPACDDFVKVQGRYFMCGGNLFYPLATEYCTDVIYPDVASDPPVPGDYLLSKTCHYGPDVFQYSVPLTLTDCLRGIRQDLNVLHNHMGFNVIRTCGFGPAFSAIPSDGEHTLRINAMKVNAGGWPYGLGTPMDISTLMPQPDPYAFRDRYYLLIDSLLEEAHANSIKVILDLSPANELINNHFTYYLTYLEELATHIHSLPAYLSHSLLGYVTIEEPNILVAGASSFTKSEICDMTSQMYDALYNNDPDHLITIGGNDILDVMNWDPGIMKMDFWCPHPYPYSLLPPIELNSDQAVERIKGQLYWYKNNCPVPWMIGETGFGATDDHAQDPGHPSWPVGALHFPQTDGELDFPAYDLETYNQKNYAVDILNMNRACNAAGFTWWQFQEVLWGPIWNGSFMEDGYGLLRHGEPYPVTQPYPIEKPVTQAFSSYLDANGQPPSVNPAYAQMPATYYNPFNYPSTTQYTGTVTSLSTGMAISNAVIKANTKYYLYIDPENQKEGLPYTYTFCENIPGLSSGSFIFNVSPPIYLLDVSHPFVISNINISYPGADIFSYVSGNNLPSPGSSLNCTIKTSPMINNRIGPVTIHNTENITYTNLGSLLLTDINVAQGGSAEYSSTIDVTLAEESTAVNGSELHLYTTPLFPNCNDFSSYLKSGPSGPNANAYDHTVGREIEVDFKLYSQHFNIFPNPTKGPLTISLMNNSTETNKIEIQIFTLVGNLVYSVGSNSNTTQIDLSHLPKGIYTNAE